MYHLRQWPWIHRDYEHRTVIDGVPINSMAIFHGYVSHNQMVYPSISQYYPIIIPANHPIIKPY